MRLFYSFFLIVSALAAASADWIWTGRYVVTMDPGRTVVEDGAIAIRGARILATGPRVAIERAYQARQRLDRPDAILAPGLVNTHTHAAMSLFRGIAGDVRLQDWLDHYIFPAEARNVTPDFVLWGTRLACLEMLLSGTTTFTDMYYFEDAAAQAVQEAGMRAVLGETIIGFPSPDSKTPAEALAFTERFLARFHADPLVVPAVAPHAIYTNSDQTLQACRALANRYQAPLLIHLSETKRENDDCMAQRKMSPTQALDALGFFNGRTVAAHAVWVSEADLAILKARGVGLAHCPSSNMMLASGIAPVTRMLALDLPVGLGPDGPAGSNNDFNMFEEMDLAAKLQKVSTGDPRNLPAAAAVEMATIRGARALGMQRDIGSLEPGKLADIISVRLDQPNAVPLYNVYSQMVYALKGSDVQDVMVNGRLLVHDARPLTLNAGEILARARQAGRSVSQSLSGQSTTPPR